MITVETLERWRRQLDDALRRDGPVSRDSVYDVMREIQHAVEDEYRREASDAFRD